MAFIFPCIQPVLEVILANKLIVRTKSGELNVLHEQNALMKTLGIGEFSGFLLSLIHKEGFSLQMPKFSYELIL